VIDIAKVVTLPHIDIILGLPGDSPEAFLRTLERARQLPANIKVYPCLVLPDALLSRGLPEFNLEYDPYTLELKSCAGWTSDDLARVAGHLDDLVAQDDGSSGDGSGSWTIFGTNPNQKRRRDIKGDGFRERFGAFEPARL
jgi:hypothetical protein